MTASQLYNRTSSTGIPDRTTSVKVSGVYFYITAYMDTASNRPILYVDNDCRHNPEIQLDNKIGYPSMRGIERKIKRQLRDFVKRVVVDQMDTRDGDKLAKKLNGIINKEAIVKKYTIEQICTRYVVLVRDRERVEVSVDRFDTTEIAVGDKISLKMKVPYSISAQRRSDIREHHEDEARNGNL